MLPDFVEIFVELNPYAVEGRYAVIADDMDDAARYANFLKQLKLHVENVTGHV